MNQLILFSSVARGILKGITGASCPSRAREQLRRDILAMQVCCRISAAAVIHMSRIRCTFHAIYYLYYTDLPLSPDMQDAFTAFELCRPPVVAAVQGACIGAGIDMITACDIRCCTEAASFCIKEIDLGITADLGTLQRLFRLVGEGEKPLCRAAVPLVAHCHSAVRAGLLSVVIYAHRRGPQT